jgi:hypothetical protein
MILLTTVYEDFIQEYEKTVRKVLEFLELDTITYQFLPLSLRHRMMFRKRGYDGF